MSKSKAQLRRGKAKKFHRTLIIGVVLVSASVAIGAAAIASHGPAEAKASPQTRLTSYKNQSVSTFAGQQDPQTGQIRPLTQEEAQALAAILKQTGANKSTDGLTQVQHADGSVSMDLRGRFQNVMLARKNADGTITVGCIDNLQAGAAFFGIDPQLVGAPARPAPETDKAPAPIQ
jgi:hypothetical protein